MTEEKTVAEPRRRRRWPRRILRTLLVLLVIGAAWYGWAWWHGRVRIGPDTTVLTGPVAADGTIDYAAAIDAEWREGVTPENNAAIPLLRALGPGMLDAAVRDQVCAALGVEPPAAGEYFIAWEEFTDSRQPSPPWVGPAASMPETAPSHWPADDEPSARDQFDGAQQRPWADAEFPLVAQWLDRNAPALEIARQAGGRDRLYLPVVSQGRPRMLAINVVEFHPFVELSNAIVVSGLRHAGQGRDELAWRDLVAAYRLAALTGQRSNLIGCMLALVSEAQALDAMETLAARGQPTGIRRALREFESLPRPPGLADAFDKGERYMFLDATVCMSRGKLSLSGVSGSSNRDFSILARLPVDWNAVLRRGNRFYDLLAAAAREPVPARRGESLNQLDAEVRKLGRSWSASPTRILGERLVAILMPAMFHAQKAADKVQTKYRLTWLALALAVHKAERGAYPDSLDALVPGVLAEVPGDPFADAPFVYRRTADGYLLYSVGPNGKDEGGQQDTTTQPDADDLAVRVPPTEDD